MRSRIRFLVPLALLLPGSAVAEGVACPPGPDRLSLQVSVAIRADPAKPLYTYSYAVANDPSSAQEAKYFAVDVAPPASGIASPSGWQGKVLKIRPWVQWRAFLLADPDRVTNDGYVPPSIVQIKPGTSLGGFSFQSPKPPGAAAYHASGFVQFPVATGATPAQAELAAEEMAEWIGANCPQLARPLIDQGVTGPTIGPVDATPVRIDVKPGDDTNPVNPRSQGVTPLAILGSLTLDVRAVDPSTIRLVPSGAAPRDPGKVEDVNGDGAPDLVLHFPTPALGLRCGDTALVLAASTRTGTRLAGFDSIVTVGRR